MDIELNPGSYTCVGSLNTIRADFTPEVCGQCLLKYHRKCSRLSRYKSPASFTSATCSDQAAPPQAIPAGVEHTNRDTTTKQPRCVVCCRSSRRGTQPVRCSSCIHIAHRSCNDFSCQANRSQWQCGNCAPISATTTTTPTATTPSPPVYPSSNSSCPECHSKLANIGQHLVFQKCHRRCHLMCAKETRTTLEKMRRLGKWTLPTPAPCLPCTPSPEIHLTGFASQAADNPPVQLQLPKNQCGAINGIGS